MTQDVATWLSIYHWLVTQIRYRVDFHVTLQTTTQVIGEAPNRSLYSSEPTRDSVMILIHLCYVYHTTIHNLPSFSKDKLQLPSIFLHQNFWIYENQRIFWRKRKKKKKKNKPNIPITPTHHTNSTTHTQTPILMKTNTIPPQKSSNYIQRAND